jgi:conjugal transfer pilus assembly protein TraK
VRLWQEARFTLQQTFTGRSLIGEKYLLANVSNATMVLEEPEFFKDGVVSVTVENQNLPAGASTNVFIVRKRGGRGD